MTLPLYHTSSKFTNSDVVVEGRDFLVSYQIVNTGNAAATKIEVSDRYDPARLEVTTPSFMVLSVVQILY